MRKLTSGTERREEHDNPAESFMTFGCSLFHDDTYRPEAMFYSDKGICASFTFDSDWDPARAPDPPIIEADFKFDLQRYILFQLIMYTCVQYN